MRINVKSFKQKVKLIGKLSQGVEGGCRSKEHVPGSQILVMAIINKEWERNEKTSKQTKTRLNVFVWKRRFFFSGLAYCPHVSGENGYQKSFFSKTLSSVGIFDRLAVLLWEDKTKVFENDTSRSWIPVNAHAPIKDATVYSWMLVWTDKTNSKTQRVDADFLENGEKISKFKQNRIRVVWALEHRHKNFLTNEMIFLHKIP